MKSNFNKLIDNKLFLIYNLILIYNKGFYVE